VALPVSGRCTLRFGAALVELFVTVVMEKRL
jgi:hypothetical protein